MQSSIEHLPSCVTNLKLTMVPHFQETKRQLSFRNLTRLEDLEMDSCGLDQSISLLPLQKIHVPGYSISQPLPNSFKSLMIYSGWKKSMGVSSLLQKFIAPLDNLSKLTIFIDKNDIKDVNDGVDDDDVFGQCIRSSNICNSLESLHIEFGNVANMSTFWKNFILPLQNLIQLTLCLDANAKLIVEKWPPRLNYLCVNFDDRDPIYPLVSYSGEECSRLELGGLSKSKLRFIKFSGCGNMSFYDRDQSIVLSYDEEDFVEYMGSIQEYNHEDDTKNPPISMHIRNIGKGLIEGDWKLYRYEFNNGNLPTFTV
ncbi:unnamed protein product [Ambrosiozyma monospora]|uniref:Unnamed protein product n=1 Tax=Ambrosiozyma monospora TaxID=43982 RepID=A0ACB5TIY0_AMBMO|nr:unnamed protein product [Ambrosiozyma monospora]